MKALLISKNLLGDGLNIYPALAQWRAKNADAEITFLCNGDYTADVYRSWRNMNMAVVTEDPRERTIPKMEYDFVFDFDVNMAFGIGDRDKLHITHAYAKMLGVTLPDNISAFTPRFDVTEAPHEKDLVLLSVFSNSCSSRQGGKPNKMLPWWKVQPILTLLRTIGKVGILGAELDRAPIEASETEYYTGYDLNEVALMLRDCKMLFTIDNGLMHLATTQQTRSVVLYPACLSPHWISPIGNQNAHIMQADPNEIAVPDLLWNVTNCLKEWKLL